jgi:hypothetical protein
MKIVEVKDDKKCPTVEEIQRRHTAMKSHYSHRDQLIKDFCEMIMLESPFRGREGKEDSGVVLPSGEVIFSIDTFPFNVATLVQSMTADKHPYVSARPSSAKHTPDQVAKFERFMQGILDERLKQSDLTQEAFLKLYATGWNIAFFPYDATLEDKGKFPFRIEILSPLGVYPMLDSYMKPLWVSYECNVTGYQLKNDYGMYAGVAELFESEPEDNKDRNRKNDLFTSTFKVIRYYDDVCTALLLDCKSVSEEAVRRNPTLRKYVERGRKGKPTSVLVGSDIEDPHAGVFYHKMGRVPFHIEGCWLEPYESNQLNHNSVRGRLIYLPFMFSLKETWKDRTRVQSMLQTALLHAANPLMVVKGEVDVTSNPVVLQAGTDENFTFANPPSLSGEALQIYNILVSEEDKGAFSPAAYGARSGTSGIQQQQQGESGTVRLNNLYRKVERLLEGVGAGITEISINMKLDNLEISGRGDKYGQGYAEIFDAEDFGGYCPNFDVSMMPKNGFDDPQAVAKFASLANIGVPREILYYKVLKEPNPQRLIELERKEYAMKEASVTAPYIEIEALKAKLDNLKEKIKLEQELEDLLDWGKLWKKQQQVKRELQQLPDSLTTEEAGQVLHNLAEMLQAPPPDIDKPVASPVTAQAPSSVPPQSIGTAPGQSMQPIQPITRLSGISQTNSPSTLMGANNIMAQIPPDIREANSAVLPLPQDTVTLGRQRNRRRRAGR